MIAAYLDSSVLVRVILEQPNPLADWNRLELGFSSQLARVECYRAIEGLWRRHILDEDQYESMRKRVDATFKNIELLEINEPILKLAAKPFAEWVASLDAIHLATAIVCRRSQRVDERPILFATHDRQLAKAAEAMHFDVIGAAQ